MKVVNQIWLVLIVINTTLFAQSPFGELRGKITDSKTNKPLDYASVCIKQNGVIKAQVLTDDSGSFIIKPLAAGKYSLEASFLGYMSTVIDGIIIARNQTTYKNISMISTSGVELKCAVIKQKAELVDREGKAGMATRSTNIITRVFSGVDSRNGSTPNIRGARVDGTAYYIDGVRVQGATTSIPQNAVDGERYKKTEESDYTNVTQQPLSTFSIDVDKASYANIRRYINDNMLPPADAIRIEEMINYFDYQVQTASSVHPFTIKTEMANAPWDKNKKLVHITLKAPEINMDEAPVNNLTFLIDVSGSMSSSDKLPLLVESLKLLVEKLRPQDKISIVVYAGAAGAVLKPTSGKEKDKILEALNRLQAGGSTAGGAGIELAYKLAKANFIQGGNNRVILATDGDFNVGTTDVDGLTKLIEEKRETGIYITVLGLGTGNINDETMEMLADKGNGNYHYIDGIYEGKKVLVTEMGGTLFTVAKDVKIQIEFNPKFVKSYKLLGYENRKLAAEDFNNDKKDAGELGAGHCVTAIYEIVTIANKELAIDSLRYQQATLTSLGKGNEVMNIKVRYKKPEATESIKFEVPVLEENKQLNEASSEMRFALSVALFGLKLRGSKMTKHINFNEIVTMGKEAKGVDEHGYRAEFIRLVETAELLAKR